MKRQILLAAVIGVIVGILLSPFLSIWGWSPMRDWGPMMGGNNGDCSGSGGSSIAGSIDRHFIEQMIPHHDDAILMAEIALKKAEHPEIATLAKNIKRTQSEENTKMRKWYRSWYDTDVPEKSVYEGMGGRGMGGGMMGGGMMGDATDVNALRNAKQFDKEFIEQMIPHHQMAIMMTTMLLQGTERKEMKTLGQAIIDTQSKEIDQMRSWYRNWY